MSPWSLASSSVHLDPSLCGNTSSDSPISNSSVCSDLDGTDRGSALTGPPVTAGGEEFSPINGVVFVTYALICLVGLAGNGLVVFVIARYANMKTVTNLYILNLSMADGVFLLGIPLLTSTLVAQRWVLGLVVCKVYYVMSGVNAFTGSFTLTVMSADRYLAICHPITAITYRTPRHALLVIGVLWAVSFLPMVPLILYAGLVPHPLHADRYTCTVDWPTAYVIDASHVFVIYNLVLGFLVPVAVICVFYGLLVLRLRGARPAAAQSTSGRAARHPKVTRLVTLIIGVYIVCWLPYWAFQIHLITDPFALVGAYWKIYLYHVLTLLSYANSMVNPLLYAFTNHNFRESFTTALRCCCGLRRRLAETGATYEMTGREDRPRGKRGGRRFQISGCSKTGTTDI